jgi:hypothetical protein
VEASPNKDECEVDQRRQRDDIWMIRQLDGRSWIWARKGLIPFSRHERPFPPFALRFAFELEENKL